MAFLVISKTAKTVTFRDIQRAEKVVLFSYKNIDIVILSR